jgi:hypothetical protein
VSVDLDIKFNCKFQVSNPKQKQSDVNSSEALCRVFVADKCLTEKSKNSSLEYKLQNMQYRHLEREPSTFFVTKRWLAAKQLAYTMAMATHDGAS